MRRKATLFWLEVVCETCAGVGPCEWSSASRAQKTLQGMEASAVARGWIVERGMTFCSHNCRNQALEEVQIE